MITQENLPEAQEILNATPEELTLMLYNGAITFINESISASGQDVEKSNNANERVQRIINELLSTLDMQHELSKNLASLYEYMGRRLQDAKSQNDTGALREVRMLITELRDTWQQAISK
jgi:flagellar protein FliS